MKLIARVRRVHTKAISSSSASAASFNDVSVRTTTTTQALGAASSIRSNGSSSAGDAIQHPKAQLTAALNEELQLELCSFLSTRDLGCLLQVNHHWRALLTGSKAQNLWTAQCQRQWPWISTNHRSTNPDHRDDSIVFVDDLKLPTKNSASSKMPNLSLLLSLSCPHPSCTKIDESLYVPSKWDSWLRRFVPIINTASVSRRGGETAMVELETVLLPVPANNSTKYQPETTTTLAAAVQYTGRVGHGDRCIRANHPLPRPTRLCSYTTPKNPLGQWMRHYLVHFGKKTTARTKHSGAFVPFVAPFVVQGGSSQDKNHHLGDINNNINNMNMNKIVTMNVTPRLVSYFEVSILHPRDTTTDNDNDDLPLHRLQHGATMLPETVGVGLAKADFDLHKHMPGWTDNSYGYHGDDGGLYHASGEPIHVLDDQGRALFPTFGAGDVIGCGIDYHQGAIFYTRNGQFLGYAFGLSCQDLNETEFYPVVGVDTKCPVQCNFGCEQAFVFDLASFVGDQSMVTRTGLQPSSKGKRSRPPWSRSRTPRRGNMHTVGGQ